MSASSARTRPCAAGCGRAIEYCSHRPRCPACYYAGRPSEAMRAREREAEAHSADLGRLICAVEIAARLLGLTAMELVELGELAELRRQSERERWRWRLERIESRSRRVIPAPTKSETRIVRPGDEGDDW